MPLLFPAFLVSAALAIASASGLLAAPWLLWLTKPLTTLLVIAHAAQRGRENGRSGQALRRAVLAGLGLSLLGDVALLWPREGFLPGLVAFLLAHLAYLVAFTRGGVRFIAHRGPFVVYAVVAGAVLWRLWPGVPGALRAPVIAYVLCLAAMAAQAAARWLLLSEGSTVQARLARRAALGGGLFLVSDALLATNKFAGPVPLASLWVLASYWAAQWLIASALPPQRR
ncbi:lysoplasmalogenase [Aquabacterium sp. OR-4]|uniref:lysoplasmalogenase n=1 Tax=Aquabacterium sp. OR-4 TaxID=2978127 RepID=UPI0021B3D808|nr:lysoplasmalogenase [Aquabacterium sp. OR-4]MDT7837750.1 lysoplasmalogenase [Aquabacterium sp. OR-4]